jgi:hypothetical protein
MRRPLIFACCFVLAGLAAQAASAAMINGQFVPDGLVGNVGAEYRLIFVTAGATRGDQITKTFYDTFVQGEADLSPLFAGKNSLYKWQAVVTVGDSLPTTGAPTYLASDVLAGSEPIYNLSSAEVDSKVRNNGDAPIDGALLSPVKYDQYAGDAGFTWVWTGVAPTPAPEDPIQWAQTWLGAGDGDSYIGKSWLNTKSWISALEFDHVDAGGEKSGAAVYGISGVLTVPVPEPSTLVLWSLFTGVAGLVFWRKRRQSN